LAVLGKFYPGSWPPTGEEQIVRAAEPYFEQISRNNGRVDHIETMEQWGKLWNFSFPKLFASLKLLPLYLTDQDFRYKIEAVRHTYNNECFKRDIMDHQRMVFQKR
jgi:cyclopropane-fatty-acyl-phospholipid synthase